MVLGRRVCADRVEPEVSDLQAVLGSDGPDAFCRGPLVRTLQDSIHVDHAARPESRERVAQVVERRVRQVEDDAVDGPDLLQDLAGIALVGRDPVDSVGRDVRTEQRDRRGVHIGGVDDLGPTSFRDEDGVRTHPGEWIGDDLGLEDLIGDSQAFRSEPRAEVCLRQIDRVEKAVFPMHRRRASLARDDLDGPNPALSLHPTVLHNDPKRGVPPEDCAADLLAIPPQLVRDLHDGDVPNHVERAGKRLAERLRHLNDVFVAPDRHESPAEFPLFRWKIKIHPCRRWDEQKVSFPDDAEMPVQDAQIHEPKSDLLPPLPRYDDTPRAHGSAIPRHAVKGFRNRNRPLR